MWEIEADGRVVATVSDDEDTSGTAPVVCDADGDGLADVREALHRTLGWRMYMTWKQTHSSNFSRSTPGRAWSGRRPGRGRSVPWGRRR